MLSTVLLYPLFKILAPQSCRQLTQAPPRRAKLAVTLPRQRARPRREDHAGAPALTMRLCRNPSAIYKTARIPFGVYYASALHPARLRPLISRCGVFPTPHAVTHHDRSDRISLRKRQKHLGDKLAFILMMRRPLDIHVAASSGELKSVLLRISDKLVPYRRDILVRAVMI